MQVVQSCPTLHDPMDWDPPGSSVQGIHQARIQEWVAISFSNFTTHSSVYVSVPAYPSLSSYTQ